MYQNLSYYYRYQFCSPEAIFALVKEELKSYFDTGAVDDALFNVYVNKCLDKLGRGSYKLEQTLLHVKDFETRLPEDFIAVREAWLCAPIDRSMRLPSADYKQVTTTSTRIDTKDDVFCDTCSSCETPDIVRAIYKTTFEVIFQARRIYLLQPGNVTVRQNCSFDCANIGISSPDTFDIRDNKFVVNFREGVVHLVYYIEEFDENGHQLVPDNVRIKEYIESYIKYKIFEQLYNQVTDETYNQIERKYENYKAEQFEKQALAEIEIKKQTAHQRHQASQRTRMRNRKYEIR